MKERKKKRWRFGRFRLLLRLTARLLQRGLRLIKSVGKRVAATGSTGFTSGFISVMYLNQFAAVPTQSRRKILNIIFKILGHCTTGTIPLNPI